MKLFSLAATAGRPRPALLSLLLAALGILPLGLAASSGAEGVGHDEAITVEIERSVAVSEQVLRARVLDFAAYEDRVPIVQEVEVLRQDAEQSLVRFRYRVVRAGDFDLTRRFVHLEGGDIVFDSREGSLGRLTGGWSFAADPAHADRTLVRYRASLEPAFAAPDFLVRHVLKSEAPALLEALVPAA